MFVLMQTFKEQSPSELSEHEQSHCLRGLWPMCFLFFLPLHRVFCMKQSVASMSPLNSADIRYAFEARWDPPEVTDVRSEITGSVGSWGRADPGVGCKG